MSVQSHDHGAEILPLTGMRGIIAQRMLTSAQETARVTLHADCDASALKQLRTHFNASGPRISYEDLLLFALARVLLRHTCMNGVVTGQEVRRSATVNAGVAVALKAALIVPTLFGLETRSVGEIAAARTGLIERARVNRLTPAEVTGATFTVSNIGFHRIRYFAPIINAPQIAILGIGQIALAPWVDENGSLCVRPILGLSLSFDHRAVDGEPAAAFLTDFIKRLESLRADDVVF